MSAGPGASSDHQRISIRPPGGLKQRLFDRTYRDANWGFRTDNPLKIRYTPARFPTCGGIDLLLQVQLNRQPRIFGLHRVNDRELTARLYRHLAGITKHSFRIGIQANRAQPFPMLQRPWSDCLSVYARQYRAVSIVNYLGCR